MRKMALWYEIVVSETNEKELTFNLDLSDKILEHNFKHLFKELGINKDYEINIKNKILIIKDGKTK